MALHKIILSVLLLIAVIEACPHKCHKCGKHEEYREGGICEPTCDEPYKECECGITKMGCYCKPGYVRHEGKCIKLCDCPCTCCGKNEEYREGGICEPTCDEPDKECECGVTKMGCYCKPGYVRHNGKCIRLCDCPCTCCGKNEEYREGGICEPTCDEPDKECYCGVTKMGCYCKPGYVRHEGKCIRLCDCPCTCCGKNEEYREGGICEPTCDEPDKECECGVTKMGCYCKPGYVRHNGKCIRLCDCPCTCCGKNEEYREGGICEPTCDEPDKECYCGVTKMGCYCKPGYVRHEGKCIRLCDCPCTCCGKNEEYREGGICEPTCDEPDKECECGVTKMGCYCKPGYVRHNGKCIRLCDCPCTCCGKNEEYREGGICEPTCDEPDKECYCGVTKMGCYCKPGYVRHEGKCIRLCDCPCTCCGKNEEYREGGICEPTCDEPDKECECGVTKMGCYCKPGYVRHNGKCIRLCDCPCTCCGKNEEYREGGICEPTCDEPDKECECGVTKMGCYCKPGYVRHNGKCIRLCDCPCTCCGKNEEYREGGICEPTCDEPDKECYCGVTKMGCYCKPGYVRHEGKCIRLCDCPCTCCGKNEEYREGGICEPTCDEPDKECYCGVTKMGCYCKPGYVRHEGKCIRLCDCPCTCCGENEEYREGGICEPTCEEPNKVCYCGITKMGCYCKPGYVRHEGKCIPLCECPCDCETVRVKKSPRHRRSRHWRG